MLKILFSFLRILRMTGAYGGRNVGRNYARRAGYRAVRRLFR